MYNIVDKAVEVVFVSVGVLLGMVFISFPMYVFCRVLSWWLVVAPGPRLKSKKLRAC